MKKIIIIFVALLCVAFLSSCNEETKSNSLSGNWVTDNPLSGKPEKFSLKDDGNGSATVGGKVLDISWKYTDGNQITVVLDPNNSHETTHAKFTLSYDFSDNGDTLILKGDNSIIYHKQ